MISKNKVKFIISLQKKKTRDEENLFVIEGDKLVREFLRAKKQIKILAAKPEFIKSLTPDMMNIAEETESVSYEELKKLSSLKAPHNALAVVVKPDTLMDINNIFNQISVSLENVQDPGNLGTIIRAAAWFGIKDIVCSPDSVDLYNPKVIQSTMGAILHVNVHYTELNDFLLQAKEKNVPVFGTLLDGQSIYDNKLASKGVILLGNESKGISEDLMPLITQKIRIPGTGNSTPGIDSLNVGMAASIVFSEFFRRKSG